jgi:hypothetical protein
MVLNRFATKFENFLATIPGAERVDDLAKDGNLEQAKRADFLFEGRTVVCEVKSLETRTNRKANAILRSSGIQVPQGGAWLMDLLGERADKNELYDRVVNAGTTALADGLADANRQIGATKEAFGLNSADGLLIILHGTVQDTNPNVIVRRVIQRFAKTHASGRPYHDQINLVCIFSEKHKLELPSGALADVVISLTNPRVPERHDVIAVAKAIQERWATLNSRRTLTVEMPELPPSR